MNNLILVRHGQSFWNKERRFTGWADIDLTEHGKSEAKFAGQLIKKLNIEFDTYFTSELKRAKNSLEIILEILGNLELFILLSKIWIDLPMDLVAHKYNILDFGCFDKIFVNSRPTYPVAPAITIFNESFIFFNYISYLY